MVHYLGRDLKRFDVRNTDIALLSSEAAIDISNYKSGYRKDGESVQLLSKLIHEATEGEKRAMEPGNNLVLSYAISGRENYNKYWEGKKCEEVIPQAKLISENLKNFEKLPEGELEKLIEFCIRLSREVRIYYNDLYPHGHRHWLAA